MTPIPQNSIALFITEIEAFGGAERSVLALSRWLYEHGYNNHVLTYEDRLGVASYASHPVEVVQLKPLPGLLHKIRAVRGAIPKTAPRPILSGYQPSLHCTLAGVRGFHVLMHDTPSLFGDAKHRSRKGQLRTLISNRIIAHGLRSGGTTTVNSEYLQNECRRDFGIEAKIVRMGGLSTAHAHRVRPVQGTLRMLSVCRIEENKRIDWLLRALGQMQADIQPRMPDWRLDLIGRGSKIQSLVELANQLGIGDRVAFHGFVSDEELETYYDRAHLFLMPAIQGYGIPALEAIQRGVPVMLHRESGVSDILLDTPWATVMDGGEEQTAPKLRLAMQSVLECRHCEIPPPHIPTEEEWAQQVATLFGYPPKNP